MSNVVAVHAVEDLEAWLGKDNRPGFFKQFCSGYRLYRLPNDRSVSSAPSLREGERTAKVAVVLENVDLAKLQKILGDARAEAKAANKADTVLDSFELFVELEGAR